MRFSIFPICGFQYSLFAVLNIPYMRFSIFLTCGSQYSLYVGFQYSLYVGSQYSLYAVLNIPYAVLNIPCMRFSIFPICGSQYSLYAVLNIPYAVLNIPSMRFSIFPICGSQYWPFHWNFQSLAWKYVLSWIPLFRKRSVFFPRRSSFGEFNSWDGWTCCRSIKGKIENIFTPVFLVCFENILILVSLLKLRLV